MIRGRQKRQSTMTRVMAVELISYWTIILFVKENLIIL